MCLQDESENIYAPHGYSSTEVTGKEFAIPIEDLPTEAYHHTNVDSLVSIMTGAETNGEATILSMNRRNIQNGRVQVHFTTDQENYRRENYTGQFSHAIKINLRQMALDNRISISSSGNNWYTTTEDCRLYPDNVHGSWLTLRPLIMSHMERK